MLSDIKRIQNIEGATFIYSMWDGYLQDDSMIKMMGFVNRKNMKFHQVHTSGHAGISTLKKVVKKLNPQKIIPIHTFHPGKYAEEFKNIHQLSDGEAYEV